jgi:hypothetical protein
LQDLVDCQHNIRRSAHSKLDQSLSHRATRSWCCQNRRHSFLRAGQPDLVNEQLRRNKPSISWAGQAAPNRDMRNGFMKSRFLMIDASPAWAEPQRRARYKQTLALLKAKQGGVRPSGVLLGGRLSLDLPRRWLHRRESDDEVLKTAFDVFPTLCLRGRDQARDDLQVLGK